MKKTASILLAVMMLAVLGACGNDKDADSPSPTISASVPATTIVPTTTVDTTGTVGDEVTKSAKTEADENGSHAELSITWDGDEITKVDWKEYSNGELKDENYGKDMGDDTY